MSKEIVKQKKKKSVHTDKDNQKVLVLHNDEIHTFDFVIKALIEICGINREQAEQITYLVHFKGKADVKKGSIETLKPLRRGLADRGLKATID